MKLHWDLTITLGDILVAVSFCATLTGIAWRALLKADRFIHMLREYPPHRHVAGEIQYPEGFTPPRTEKVSV